MGVAVNLRTLIIKMFNLIILCNLLFFIQFYHASVIEKYKMKNVNLNKSFIEDTT